MLATMRSDVKTAMCLCLSGVLATSIAGIPRIGLAEEPTSVDTLDAEAAREFDTAIANFERNPAAATRAAAQAARTWRKLVESTPEGPETDAWRQIRIGKTLNSFRLAYQLSEDCRYIEEAVEAANSYLETVPPSSENHAATQAQSESVAGEGKECPISGPDVPDEAEAEGPKEEDSEAGEVEDPKGDANESQNGVTLADNRSPDRSYKLLAITSGVLTGATIVVSLGTGLVRVREPFEGAAYKSILNAARASYEDADPTNNVSYGSEDDMCANARAGAGVNAEVISACDRWDRLGKVAVATGVLTAVFAVSTVVFSVLAVKARRKSEKLSFGVGPLRGGGGLVGTGRF